MSIETSEPQNFLANLSRVKQILAETGDIRIVLDIRDAAVAANAYARAKSSDEVAQLAMDIKLRAERKAGGFLQEMKATKQILSHERPRGSQAVTLSDLGINKMESTRWQRIALIPEERFESYLFNARQRTQSALLTEARKILFDAELEAIRKEIPNIESIPGKYNVIVVDPPWPYDGKYDPSHWMGRVASPYPQMSIEEIKQIKLPTTDDCIVWLWTTNKYLHEAYHILDSWELEPKAVLTWVKDRMGVGYWLRNITEHCIMATKGRPPITLTNQTTALKAYNKGHSIKPDEFYVEMKKIYKKYYGRIMLKKNLEVENQLPSWKGNMDNFMKRE